MRKLMKEIRQRSKQLTHNKMNIQHYYGVLRDRINKPALAGGVVVVVGVIAGLVGMKYWRKRQDAPQAASLAPALVKTAAPATKKYWNRFVDSMAWITTASSVVAMMGKMFNKHHHR